MKPENDEFKYSYSVTVKITAHATVYVNSNKQLSKKEIAKEAMKTFHPRLSVAEDGVPDHIDWSVPVYPNTKIIQVTQLENNCD